MTARYTIVDTVPTTYIDKSNKVINGVLVHFNIQPYDEVHEIRVPKMDVTLVKLEIEKAILARDELAALGKVE